MKRVLIGVGVLFLLVLSAGGVVTYRFLAHTRADLAKARKPPAELTTARIVTGSGSFAKSTYLTPSGVGVITEIEPLPDHGLSVVGRRGAVNFDAGNAPGKTVHFGTCFGGMVATTIGKGSYFCRANLMSGPTLIDSNGEALWTMADDSIGIGADDAAPGEVGPAKTPGVAVGMNGGGGVRLLTPEGKVVWKQPDGNVWHVEIVPAQDGSGNVIVHSNAGGELTVRDGNGKILNHCSRSEIYLSEFSPTAWGKDPVRNKLIAEGDNGLYVLSLDGRTVAKLPAPGNEARGDQPKGIPVRFTKGDPFYAAIVNHALWDRTLLYIYDASGKVMYDEILDHNCNAIQTVEQADGTAKLLLGCENTVLQYAQR